MDRNAKCLRKEYIILFSNLKSCLHHIIEDYCVPGVDCIVYQNHVQVFRHIVGLSDLESQKPMTGNELYYIFSMTKMLTCTAALQLWEQGKYDMDDPVSKYLPEYAHMQISPNGFDAGIGAQVARGGSLGSEKEIKTDNYAKTQITIRHLFTMTAGLDYNLRAEGITKAIADGKITTLDIVKAISETVLGFEPGTRYRYSLCHDVLAGLVEVWSGQTFGEYLRENITAPLGMHDTTFHMPEDFERMAAMYIYDDPHTVRRLPLSCVFALTAQYESGGAGLISSPEDYAIFADALACGGMGKNGARILRAATIDLMRTNQLSTTQLEDFRLIRKGYGYGLGVRTHMCPTDSESLSPVGEFGWDGAAGAFSLVDPEHRLSLVFFQHVHNWDRIYQKELTNALYLDFCEI